MLLTINEKLPCNKIVIIESSGEACEYRTLIEISGIAATARYTAVTTLSLRIIVSLATTTCLHNLGNSSASLLNSWVAESPSVTPVKPVVVNISTAECGLASVTSCAAATICHAP